MKITNHARKQDAIPFEKLYAGDVFQDTDDEQQVWIKMPLSYEANDDEMCEKYNAYDVDNDEYSFFYDSENVLPLNAELIITRR